LDFLRHQGEGYRVTSKSAEITETLRFVRKLYNLESLSEFPFEQDSDNDNSETYDDDGGDYVVLNETASTTQSSGQEKSVTTAAAGVRPVIDKDVIDLKSIAIHPLKDRSVKEAVLRYLQHYVDHAPIDDPKTFLTQEHLEAFRQLTIDARQSYKVIDKEIADKEWRPVWKDVLAVYMIEKIISKTVQNSLGSWLVRLHPPYAFFDQYKYHALLHVLRNRALSPPHPLSIASSTMLPSEEQPAIQLSLAPPPDSAERPELPVDEFEDVILESVKKHRVTIIQGETGCGT